MTTYARLELLPQHGTNTVLLRIVEDFPELRLQAKANPLVCAKCGTAFEFRNHLFKHLRTECLPMVATLDLDREPPTRLALGLRYIGHSLHGMQSGPDEVEKVRPSISGVVAPSIHRQPS